VSAFLDAMERRRDQLLEQERRAKFERETLEREMRRLRVGEDEDIVRARLRSKGVAAA
jgi:cell division septum initiation protein DivIVA